MSTRNKNLKRATASVLAVITTVILLVGCSVTPDSATTSAESSATTENRQAGWFSKRARICVHNLTSQSQNYQFWEENITDTGNKSGTLGVDQWVCGYSSGEGVQNDKVWFYFGNDPTRMSEISVLNSDEFRPAIFKYTDMTGGDNSAFSDRSAVKIGILEPGVPFVGTTDIARITIETDGRVHRYADDEGYIFYARLYDPN